MLSVLLNFCAKKPVNLEGDSHSSLEKRAWVDGTQIEMVYDSSVRPEQADVIDSALVEQNAILIRTKISSNRNLISNQALPTNVNLDTISGDGKSTIYFTDTKLPAISGNSEPDALTFQRFIDNEIIEADIVFHAEAFLGKNLSHLKIDDLKVVALHELGHVLGLEHGDAIMSATVSSTILTSPFSSAYCTELGSRYKIQNCH